MHVKINLNVVLLTLWRKRSKPTQQEEGMVSIIQKGPRTLQLRVTTTARMI